MTQRSGGTNTADALRNAAVQLASPRKSIKLVMLFTDGVPNNQDEAVKAAGLVTATVRTRSLARSTPSRQADSHTASP